MKRHLLARQNGLSYVEILVAIVLISIALVPAMEALVPAISGSVIYRSETERHYHLAAKLEEVLALPYAQLDEEALAVVNETTASTLFSDADPSDSRRLVFLSRYQPADSVTPVAVFTTDDIGMLWVRVQLEGSEFYLESLASQYD